ncbi:unnamed protein product [Lupinus luteus]|uniref:Uncharacterized protein n=1 Tax=Lupinus luteus TaxID=3873 RepID=A0AAV1Y155_LUPLU
MVQEISVKNGDDDYVPCEEKKENILLWIFKGRDEEVGQKGNEEKADTKLAPLLGLNDLMESKGGKTKCSSSSKSSLFCEAPLGYRIEDVLPNVSNYLSMDIEYDCS